MNTIDKLSRFLLYSLIAWAFVAAAMTGGGEGLEHGYDAFTLLASLFGGWCIYGWMHRA